MRKSDLRALIPNIPFKIISVKCFNAPISGRARLASFSSYLFISPQLESVSQSSISSSVKCPKVLVSGWGNFHIISSRDVTFLGIPFSTAPGFMRTFLKLLQEFWKKFLNGVFLLLDYLDFGILHLELECWGGGCIVTHV